MNKHLVFIASGGRTGTKFLGDMLSSLIDDCWSEHEVDMFDGFNRLSVQRIRDFGLWHMIVGRSLGLTGLRGAGTRYLAGEQSLEQCAAQMRREREAYHQRLDANLVIESYWRWWMFAGDIQAIFPGARTVGVVRDPRQWIGSWFAHEKSRSGVHWTYRLPPGPFTPGRIGDWQWADRWDQMSPVARLAWEWRTINQRIVDGAARDGNCKLFRFEDIFVDKSAAMAELVEFVSVFPERRYDVGDLTDFTRNRRNQSAANGSEWQNWSRSDKEAVDELCGDLMDHFGYPRLLASHG